MSDAAISSVPTERSLLIVEDEKSFLQRLARALEDRGFIRSTAARSRWRIKLAAFRIECERCRVTRVGRKRCLIGAVRRFHIDPPTYRRAKSH